MELPTTMSPSIKELALTFQGKRLSLRMLLQLMKSWGYLLTRNTERGTSRMWVLSQMTRDKETLRRAWRCSGMNTPGFSHQNLEGGKATQFCHLMPRNEMSLQWPRRKLTGSCCHRGRPLPHSWKSRAFPALLPGEAKGPHWDFPMGSVAELQA